MYSASCRVMAQIAKCFCYHPPVGNQVERYGQLRDAGRDLAMLIATLTPDSREQSLALTKLEEAIFYANASIARNEVWEGRRMIAPLKLELPPLPTAGSVT